MRAVRFDRYGGIEVLQVVEVEDPAPGQGQVLVRVKAAGINPGEGKIRQGRLHERYPATFPSGQGSDFAGVVERVGTGVERVAAGDQVLGWTDQRASHAELVAAPADHVTPKPPEVPWEAAGALFVAGCTAYAMVRAAEVRSGDTVAVAGAAGGVGCLASQLARQRGARVIGLAGPAHHDWLRAHGIEPVAYGDDVAARVRTAAPDGVDAMLDTQGRGYVELALELGVAPERIDTVADFSAPTRHPGVKLEGNAAAASAEVLGELAAMVAEGRLEVPIAATYPLADVQAAFRELERGHTRGKIVLVP